MSLHISRFLDKIRAAEHRQQRNVTLTVNEAKDLHTDITRILLRLEELQRAPAASDNNITQIAVDGGSF